MVRKTLSYSLFKQAFGRMLRVFDGKTHGILIDHVGNVDYMMHKYHLEYPHDDPQWTLDDYKNFQPNDDGKVSTARVCPECFNKYTPKTSSDKTCPECAHEETVEEQIDALKKFQAIDADLVPMTVDFIDRLVEERKKVDTPVNQIPIAYTGNTVARNSAMLNHTKRQVAQEEFRSLYDNYCMDLWRTGEYDIEACQRQFEIDYGINMLKAQVLSSTDTNKLIKRMLEK